MSDEANIVVECDPHSRAEVERLERELAEVEAEAERLRAILKHALTQHGNDTGADFPGSWQSHALAEEGA